MALESNVQDFFGFFIGDVINIDRKTRRVAAYIPKLMPGIAGGTEYNTTIATTVNQNITGLTSLSNTINIKNTIWLNAFDYREPLPAPGSKVFIFFMEGNPKLGYWFMFNPYGEYEVLEDERYPKLFDMNIGGKQFPVYTDDSIEIKFPSNYTTVKTGAGKQTTLELFKTENYIVSNVAPINPHQGMIWYNSALNRMSVYNGQTFERVLIGDDITRLETRIDDMLKLLEDKSITSRFMFVSSIYDVLNPVLFQIIVIDNSEDIGTYKSYTKVDDYVDTTFDGYYYIETRGVFVEKVGEDFSELEAFIYRGAIDGWDSLDGWETWTQVSEPFTLTNNLTLTEDIQTWTSPSTLKLSSIVFEGVDIADEAEITVLLKDGASNSLIQEFVLVKDANGLSLKFEPHQYSGFNLIDNTLTLLNVDNYNPEITGLELSLTSNAITTLSFTSITVNAQSEMGG